MHNRYRIECLGLRNVVLMGGNCSPRLWRNILAGVVILLAFTFGSLDPSNSSRRLVDHLPLLDQFSHLKINISLSTADTYSSCALPVAISETKADKMDEVLCNDLELLLAKTIQ